MNKNMGPGDRLLRFAVAVLIGVLYFTHRLTGVSGVVIAIIGVVFLLTSFAGSCPIYSLFGWSTRKVQSQGG